MSNALKFFKKEYSQKLPDELKYFAEYFMWLHFCQQNFQEDKNILLRYEKFLIWFLNQLTAINVEVTSLSQRTNKKNYITRYFKISQHIWTGDLADFIFTDDTRVKRKYPSFYYLSNEPKKICRKY